MRFSRLTYVFQSLLHCRPPQQISHPSGVSRVFLSQSFIFPDLLQHSFADLRPGHKREIGVRALVANEPSTAIACEPGIQHADDTESLVDVAINSRGQLNRMETREPSGLPGVRSLAYLKSQVPTFAFSTEYAEAHLKFERLAIVGKDTCSATRHTTACCPCRIDRSNTG